jgi:hypothetical protein
MYRIQLSGMIRQRFSKIEPINTTVEGSTVKNSSGTYYSDKIRINQHTDNDIEIIIRSEYDNQLIHHPHPRRDWYKYYSIYNCYYYIFHILSVLIISIGIRLTFSKLYTHIECDMTWSQRQFILVDILPDTIVNSVTNTSTTTTTILNYKFYTIETYIV